VWQRSGVENLGMWVYTWTEQMRLQALPPIHTPRPWLTEQSPSWYPGSGPHTLATYCGKLDPQDRVTLSLETRSGNVT
jgi:hypothetical protein